MILKIQQSNYDEIHKDRDILEVYELNSIGPYYVGATLAGYGEIIEIFQHEESGCYWIYVKPPHGQPIMMEIDPTNGCPLLE